MAQLSIIPNLTLKGTLDWFAVITGVIVGFAVFNGPMTTLSSSLRKGGNGGV